MTHIFQKIDGIAGKAADGFCQDNIDLSGFAIRNKLLETSPLFRSRARYAVIYLKSIFDTM